MWLDVVLPHGEPDKWDRLMLVQGSWLDDCGFCVFSWQQRWDASYLNLGRRGEHPRPHATSSSACSIGLVFDLQRLPGYGAGLDFGLLVLCLFPRCAPRRRQWLAAISDLIVCRDTNRFICNILLCGVFSAKFSGRHLSCPGVSDSFRMYVCN